jgi:hypothetical protein
LSSWGTRQPQDAEQSRRTGGGRTIFWLRAPDVEDLPAASHQRDLDPGGRAAGRQAQRQPVGAFGQGHDCDLPAWRGNGHQQSDGFAESLITAGELPRMAGIDDAALAFGRNDRAADICHHVPFAGQRVDDDAAAIGQDVQARIVSLSGP